METSIFDVFNKYSDKGYLKGRMFTKMFRDLNIISSPDETNSLDLIFTKYKSRKSVGIQYEDFIKSLEDVSKILNLEVSELKNKLVGLSGPIYKGTSTVPVRFYDDKTLFTGVHLHGGPSIVERSSNNGKLR